MAEAVASRRSIRAFLNRPVDPAVLRRVAREAGRAASGGNIQPWHIYVVAGAETDRLKTLMMDRLAVDPRGEEGEYDIYPEELGPPYTDRRFAVGEAMYVSLSIAREDRAARRTWFNRNYQLFGAPVALFCFVDRMMGPAQWSDCGMYLQSLMLLLRGEGLDSCAQEAWALFPRTISAFVGAPPDQMLFTGMAIGYADPDASVNSFPIDRAPLDMFATFLGLDA